MRAVMAWKATRCHYLVARDHCKVRVMNPVLEAATRSTRNLSTELAVSHGQLGPE